MVDDLHEGFMHDDRNDRILARRTCPGCGVVLDREIDGIGPLCLSCVSLDDAVFGHELTREPYDVPWGEPAEDGDD